MLTLILKIVGFTLARTPEFFLRGLASFLGSALYVISRRRKRIALSNLAHAFPEQEPTWRVRTAKTSMIRLVETGLLSLASPFLSESRLRQIARPGPGMEEMLRARINQPFPTVLASIHLAYWECQTWMGLLSTTPIGDFGVIYRPLDDPRADAFVRQTRERFGMRLLSRKEGFAQALKILRGNGCIGLLFDQNAGLQGALSTLFGRVCASTELPGILAEKFSAEVRIIYPVRIAFWRVELRIDTLARQGTAAGVTVALNQWQETHLRADHELCSSWLWSHDRWRNQDIPSLRFRLQAKRDILSVERVQRNWGAIPRNTRIVVRLPNWLGDVVMVLPLLRQLRHSRPDAAITLVGKAPFRKLLEKIGFPFEGYVPLPPRGLTYWRPFLKLRSMYPDVYLLFTNSARGDLEAWLTGCRQRFGIVRPGHRRPLLTHSYRRPEMWNEKESHQFSEWQLFMEHFGLVGATDRRPLEVPRPKNRGRRKIGLIVGSENTPSKRWPVPRWREFAAAVPELTLVLLGTATDRALADEVARGLAHPAIENLAGKTDLPQFVEQLADCDLLVSNDTGGMHLANALGVPVIALFGPTNPLRTAPVFDARVVVLQPPHCPPTGGGSLDELPASAVLEALRLELERLAPPD